jgi:hypothetical protein
MNKINLGLTVTIKLLVVLWLTVPVITPETAGSVLQRLDDVRYTRLDCDCTEAYDDGVYHGEEP